MKSFRFDGSGRRAGYTLLELLIAMGLLVLLGGGLVTLLSQSVSIWNTAENRGKVYEEARAVLDRLSEDLRSTVIRAHAAGGDAWVQFLADLGPGGRQRLRFVRTISGEASDSLLRKGGRNLSTRTPAVYDGREDAREAEEGLLAAPGGHMEVFYMQDPRPGKRAVWRGVRSPVGGHDSLFIDRNVSEERALLEKPEKGGPSGVGAKKKEEEARKKEDQPPTEPPPGDEDRSFYLALVASPITSDVLFLGFNFWSPVTNTWREVPPLKDPKPGQESGPTPFWDSTRAILDLDGGREEFTWKRRAGSLEDPKDDIFPEMVEITLTVAGAESVLGPRLAEDLSESAKTLLLTREIELPLNPRDHCVLVDDEWIAIERAEGPRLTVDRDGRGDRWTKAAKHERGARVETGVTFRRVVEIPGFRTGVSDRDEPSRLKKGYRR